MIIIPWKDLRATPGTERPNSRSDYWVSAVGSLSLCLVFEGEKIVIIYRLCNGRIR